MTAQRSYRILRLPGDGIGPEIMAAASTVLDRTAALYGFDVVYTDAAIGGASCDAYGEPLTEATLADAQASDAVLLGAVGGEQWNTLPPALRPEQGLLQLRQALGLYCNLRPAKLYPELRERSPLAGQERELDLLVVRELTGGIYFGRRDAGGTGEGRWASDTERYSVAEIKRILLQAFRLAEQRRGHVTLVDKANVLASSRLWREVLAEVQAGFPQITCDTLYIDNAAMQLILHPERFDVLVTSNLFGDILSDEAAALTGSIGLLPSASIGEPGTPGLYEPVHGSAPDLAGRDEANPLAMILSVAMLLSTGVGETAAGAAIEAAVERFLQDGLRTSDLAEEACTTLGTTAAGEAVAQRLRT